MTDIATEIVTSYEIEEESAQDRTKFSKVSDNANGEGSKARIEDRYGRYVVLSAAECEEELAAESKRRNEAIEQVICELDAAEPGRHLPETGHVLKCFSLEQANAVLTRFAAKTGIQFTLLGKYGEVGHKSEPQRRAELDANAKRLHFKSARVDYDGCAHALLAEEYFVCRCGVAERSWSYMHAPEADLVRRFQHRKTCLKQRLKRQLGITTNRSTRIPPEKRRELERRLENEWQLRLETYRQTGELSEEEYATLVNANSSQRRPKTQRHSSGVAGDSKRSKDDGADDSSTNATDVDLSTVKKEREQLSSNERNVFVYVTQIFRFPQYRLLEDTPNARSRLFAALRNDWLMPAVNVVGECIYIVRLPTLTNHQHAQSERNLRSQLSMRTDLDVGLTDRSRVVRPVDKRGIPRWVGERVYFTVSDDVTQFIRRLLLEEHVHDDYAIQQRIRQRFLTRHGYPPSHGDYFNYPTRPLIRFYMRKFVPSLFTDENETVSMSGPRRAAGERSMDMYTKKKRSRDYAVDTTLTIVEDPYGDPVKIESSVVPTNISLLRVSRRDQNAASNRMAQRQYRVSESLGKKRGVAESVTITEHDAKSYVVGEALSNVDVYNYPEEADETDTDVQVQTADREGEAVSYTYVDVPPAGYEYADTDADVQETATHSHTDPHGSNIEYPNALEIVD